MRTTTTNPEPVVTRAGVAAVIVAVAALVGAQVDDDLVDALAGLVAVLAPIVAGFLARRRVTPVPTLPAHNGSEEPRHLAG